MSDATPAPASPRARGRLDLRLQGVLGLAVGVGALYLAGRSVEWSALAAALSGVNLPLVLVTLAASLLTPVLKALRWRWLFHPRSVALGTARLAGLVVIGQAINFIVPGRFGELVRTYLGGEETGEDKWFVLGTIAAEKLIDLVVLAVLVVVLIPLVALPASLANRVDLIVLSALGVTVAVAVLLGARKFWLRLARRLLGLLPPAAAARWEARVASTIDGLAALQNRRAALAIWGWTVLFWLVAAGTNLLLLTAFDLPSPAMALVLLAVLQGGIAIPSTPGKIGVFQLLCMAGLAAFGVPEATGFAYGVILHLLVVGGVTVWAALALWRRSWNLRSLAQASTSWQ